MDEKIHWPNNRLMYEQLLCQVLLLIQVINFGLDCFSKAETFSNFELSWIDREIYFAGIFKLMGLCTIWHCSLGKTFPFFPY